MWASSHAKPQVRRSTLVETRTCAWRARAGTSARAAQSQLSATAGSRREAPTR
ncbi:hypothetical protein ACFPRL_05365 [Pseudoclavibacter helvolus]